MKYGEVQHFANDDKGNTIVSTTKMRDGLIQTSESVYKERVRIMRVTDLDLIIEQMHTEHALDKSYGAWLDKSEGGKIYVVKYWVEAGSKPA